MKYEYLARVLYVEPALILPSALYSLQSLFEAHVLGGGIPVIKAEDEENESQKAKLPEMPPSFAVLWLSGPLMQYASGMGKMCAGVTSTAEFRNDLRAALADPNIQTIFVMLNSPGGQVAGTAETADLVRRASGLKNVIGVVVGQACSAAYWIGSQCTVLISQQSSMLGSVGCYLAYKDDSEKMAKDGVKWEVFRAGKFKAAGLGRPLSDEERAQYQAIADQAHADFKESVLAVRPDVPLDALEGQPFTARDALRNNLIDGIVLDVAEWMQAVIEDPGKLEELAA